MGSVIPSRITEARESRAMSMGELADIVGVTRQTISKYESGVISPSIENLQTMSFILSLPVDFFFKKEVTTSVGSSLFFRSNANIAKKIKTACKYQVKWTSEIKRQLGTYLDFIDLDIPSIDSDYEDITLDDVEEIALAVREQWGLGSSPIGDLIGIFENKGIIVAQFAESELCAFKGIDAFSSWRDGTPYILYHSRQKSAVRTRFSLLHELGHLIMHSAISDEDSVKKAVIDHADEQADRFAAAFLLPSTSFINDIHKPSLAALELVKRKWGVALSTIIRRCETVNCLTENQLAYLKRQMTANRYWHNEPLDDVLTIKGPEVLRDAVIILFENNVISLSDFINYTAFSVKELKTLCALPDNVLKNSDNRSKPILKVAGNLEA
jgi:Zn-dependent peptidase ImmA (M78 family)/transcriptional regulator with XRE-family HTH domain